MFDEAQMPDEGRKARIDVGRRGTVTNELERQAVELSELHKTISGLVDALEGVRLAGPESTSDERLAEARPVAAPVVEKIADRTEGIVQATRRLLIVLGELQL